MATSGSVEAEQCASQFAYRLVRILMSQQEYISMQLSIVYMCVCRVSWPAYDAVVTERVYC